MSRLIERILDMGNLRVAWEEMAENKGLAGVDNVSIRRWRRKWEERLVNLAHAVRTNRYKPAKLRVRRIPKKRRDQWRTLRIPTVTDRVLQRAVYHVLCELYEPRFLDCSFGYRPRRGVRDAVQRILDLREKPLQWVLDADIDDFFDNVDHGLLMGLLREDVHDPIVLRLLVAWLQVGRVKASAARGIPLGSPLSPLLANVYLHPLDCGLVEAGWEPVRYADDFIVLAADRTGAEAAYAEAQAHLEAMKLRYEPTKTCISCFEEGFEFLGVRFYRDTYSYTWQDKLIKADDDEVDWLFIRYGPRYN
jgi:group II intron reverse transcriptase/maturase